ncbi:MAG: ParA family protein [Actinomycetes bacterium]
MTVVAVLSMKGGVGKTTVTLGLASAAWSRDLTALVIDLDPQANATMAIDVTDPVFTTSDVLADARPGVAQDAIVESGWGSGVSVIASERALEHRNVAAGRNSALRLRTSLATTPRQYDIVLIDCPPSLGELTRNALSVADRAVIVTEPNHFALHGAAEALEAVDVIAAATNPGLRAATVVINRLRPDDREHALHVDQLRTAHGTLVFEHTLPECSGVPLSQRANSPLHAWNSPGSREVADLFDDLLDALLPPPKTAPREQPFSLKRYLS